jgi:hypothetical protein
VIFLKLDLAHQFFIVSGIFENVKFHIKCGGKTGLIFCSLYFPGKPERLIG